MPDPKWVRNIDKAIPDEPLDRIDFPEVRGIKGFPIDPDLVDLAVSTEHESSKIALSGLLNEQHEQHRNIRRSRQPSNASGLVSEAVLDRILFCMIRAAVVHRASFPNALLNLLAKRLSVPPIPRDGLQHRVEWNALLALDAMHDPALSAGEAARVLSSDEWGFSVKARTISEWRRGKYFKELLARARGGQIRPVFRPKSPKGL
jgi:hypothetical protein